MDQKNNIESTNFENSVFKEKPKDSPLWVVFLLLAILGLVNAIISPYLYSIIGSLVFSGESMIVLFVGPITILGSRLPILYLFFILIESLLASPLSLLLVRHIKKVPSSQKKFYHFLIALIIFILLQLGCQVIPQKFSEIKAKNLNPILTGERQYDFSNKAEINNRNSVKMDIDIEGKKVIWVEQVKSIPEFTENVWDVFLFEFNPEQGKGNTIKVSNFDKAKSKSPDSGVKSIYLGDQVYWIQDGSLYVYNDLSQKSDLIVDNVGVIYGKYKNSVLIRKAGDTDDQNLYFLDLTSKELTKFPFNGYYSDDTFSILHMNGPYLCYTSETKNYYVSGSYKYKAGRYDIETGKDISFNIPRSSKNFYPRISDCQKDYVVFTQSIKDLVYKVYDVNNDKYILEKIINKENFKGGYENAKVYDNKLYYTLGVAKDWADNYPLMSIDLITGEEALVSQNVGHWDISGGYLVYSLRSDELNLEGYKEGYNKEIFIQKISQ